MDALAFAKERRRICNYYKEKVELDEQDCSNYCPLFSYDHACYLGARIDNEDDYKNIIAIVEQWAKEHPVKTRQSECIKLFHCENLITNDGYLDIYPCNMGYKKSDNGFKLKNNTDDCCEGLGCEACKKRFWLEEIDDDK